jgi:endonuclease/exonuclease/phosphatase family metal-dependent hydrolase
MENIRLSIKAKKSRVGKTTKKSLKYIASESLKRFITLTGIEKVGAFVRRLTSVMERPGRLFVQTSPQPIEKEQECRGLTVISANLWHDWPQYRRSMERLEAFAQLAENHQADILLLQEVSRTAQFRTDDWLSRRLGMTSVYTRANGHLHGIGFEEGLAILSHHPLSRPELRQLTPESSKFVHRLALGSQVDTPCGSLLAFSVHLSINGKQNARETEKLHSWVQEVSDTMPAFVGGDFNASESSRSISNLKQKWLDTFRHLNPLADGTTHEIRWPWGKPLRRSRLDYIFLKAEQTQWKLLEALHLETPGHKHSDHRAVLLRLAPAYVKINR